MREYLYSIFLEETYENLSEYITHNGIDCVLSDFECWLDNNHLLNENNTIGFHNKRNRRG